MARILRWTVTKSDAGKKLEEFLREHGCSHHVLTHLKRTERGICLNGEWAYTTQRIKEGDLAEITITEEESSEHIVSSPLPLHIVYEDEDLMVVDKPSNMPIHPSINNYENTLANAVMYYFSQQNIPFVYRCINRLDRDTSGLLIIAKNMMSGAILSQMSADRQIHREYLTIVEGILPESGTIDAPIARPDPFYIDRAVRGDGQYAKTGFEVIAANDEYTMINAFLYTGRPHQIRVHFASVGYPLAGDTLYGRKEGCPSGLTEQALCCTALEFIHPTSGRKCGFSIDPRPEMTALCGI